jgi:hypothetical protein
MGFFVIIPIAALAAWSIFAIYRWLRRGDYEPKWWRAFRILSVGGFALGVWCAFFSHYSVAKIQLEGFPIPVSIVSPKTPDAAAGASTTMPLPIRIGGLITDVLSGMALCLAPIAVAAFLRENRGKLLPPPRETPP